MIDFTLEARVRCISEGTPMAENHPLPDCNVIAENAHDASLIRRAKRGDRHAFEALTKPYLNRLFNTILGITRNHEDAEDCLQEALLRAFTRIEQFKGASRFSTWLFRIGVNQALMHLRSKKRSFLLIDNTADDDAIRSFDPEDTRPNPELQYQAAELSMTIEKMIRVMPPVFQPVFEMRYLQELSNEEAAVALDMSTPAIKTRAFRARRHLRERLERHYGFTKGDIAS
jgi:RNA polymerase sigma-70 factor, ECF subfamily